MTKTIIYGSIIVSIIFIGLVIFSLVSSNVEHPKYTVVKSHGAIEIREYESQLVAQVTVEGPRDEAINNGFKKLADFIFGNNQADNQISMTAPVQQSKNSKIAMTAPVQASSQDKGWTIEFIMPAEYTLDSLPKPNNEEVSIIQRPSYHVISIRFSGYNSDANLSEHLAKLDTFVQDNNINTIGEPIYAFYNPPWTLPFLKRNEIQYFIEHKQ